MLNNASEFNVLLVDDTAENLRFLSESLKNEGYRIRVAPNGELALAMVENELPHLVLLDIDMPGMNGYQVCDKFKSNIRLKRIPIIFLSAIDDNQAKVTAFKHGGVDYVTKPFHIEELLARISTHLELQALRAELHAHNTSLLKMVKDQFQEIHAAQMTTIFALIKLSESRDDDTGKHIERVGSYAYVLTNAARLSTYFNCEINDQFELDIYHASAMHDIGKVGISDAILLKPGKLTAEEFDLIKTHTTIGFNTLEAITKNYPQNQMISLGAEVAYCHHEKWDGNGYPRGLKAEQIPLSARIVAIADVYDALRSKRPYKEPYDHDQTIKYIKEGSGTHFDPKLTEILATIDAEFNEIWLSHQ
jgi:putative two-component system response regulator